MGAHTKGPWDVLPFVDNRRHGGDHHTYKITPQRGVYGSMHESDALIAAAAPEMLEELKLARKLIETQARLLGIIGQSHEETAPLLADMDAVIAKAEGLSNA